MSAQKIMVLSFAGVALMFGLAFASAPLYRAFCQITGFGGTPRQIAGIAPDESSLQSSRLMTIRFDANTDPALPWEFGPEKASMQVRVGEVTKAYYYAHNLANTARTGSASFNVTPEQSGYYFTKIDCFCFTKQTLAAREKARMPVIFRIDPDIEADKGLDGVATITLSYTFYPLPEN